MINLQISDVTYIQSIARTQGYHNVVNNGHTSTGHIIMSTLHDIITISFSLYLHRTNICIHSTQDSFINGTVSFI